jgi:hypothetical protein
MRGREYEKTPSVPLFLFLSLQPIISSSAPIPVPCFLTHSLSFFLHFYLSNKTHNKQTRIPLSLLVHHSQIRNIFLKGRSETKTEIFITEVC